MFTEKLNEKLKEKGMSKKELATKIGVTPAAISNWKNNCYPTGDKLKSICKTLDMSADELLGINILPPEPPNQEAPPGALKQLSYSEIKLINYFREMNVEQQEMLLDTAMLTVEKNKKKEKLLDSDVG